MGVHGKQWLVEAGAFYSQSIFQLVIDDFDSISMQSHQLNNRLYFTQKTLSVITDLQRCCA